MWVRACCGEKGWSTGSPMDLAGMTRPAFAYGLIIGAACSSGLGRLISRAVHHSPVHA